MILANPRAIKVGEPSPFAAATKRSSFRKREDTGFAYQYQFYVNVKDSATGWSYNLQRDFKLE
jgi:hypothetical protein